MGGNKMKIYIVFGDTPRADGDNIKGVFKNIRLAKDFIKKLKTWNNDTLYHIEEHTVVE